MSARILFYVQHLQGVGHVFRASRIVAALAARDFAVTVAYGGEPVPGLGFPGAEVRFLPPLRAGEEVFNRLEDANGDPVSDAYKARRREMLLDLFDESAPDVVITEAFPFGRRQMRFELVPLVERARSRPNPPLILSSIRDILQVNAKAYKDREAADLVLRHFDRVLVHADPALVRLEKTFPLAGEIAGKLIYTGIVAPDPSGDGSAGESFDVVVSVGGGALGGKLLVAAAGAKPLSSMKDRSWLVVTGLKFTAAQEAELRPLLAEDMVVRAFLPDLRVVMSRAQLSISRAGYNTVADIYRAGCRAVVVPFFDGVETEQVTRADLLARRGLAEIVRHDEQTPRALAAAIDRAMARPAPDRGALDLNGAANTADAVARLLGAGKAARIA